MPLIADFVAELRGRFDGDIRLDRAARALYSTDASIYQIEPLGVVIPRTQEDLQCVTELAAKWSVPILPRGAGTSLAGQAIGEALILDCSRWLDRIVDLNAEAATATVEPGVLLGTLNKSAARVGLQFGPDPASAERATMGGVIGNNATGAHSIRYGMTADHLLSADVILSDGSLATWGNSLDLANTLRGDAGGRQAEILRAVSLIRAKYADAIQEHFPSVWRNSAGYRLNYLLPWSPARPAQWEGAAYPPVQTGTFDLAALLAGSEGTLAVMRRATVGLVRKPRHTVLGVLTYESIAAACDAVPELLTHGPSAVELIPRLLIRKARSVAAYAAQLGWVPGDPEALLVVEFSGEEREALRDKVRALGPSVVQAESAEDQARVWNVRKVGLGLFDSQFAAAHPVAFIEDCAVPVEKLGDYVREMERLLAHHNTQAAFYAHASAGCLHIRPILDLHGGAGVGALRTIAEQTLALTLRLGGAMSSEHGDGLARGEWLRQTYGSDVTAALRLLKGAADPQGILNPHKMLDATPMDTHLRLGPGYRSEAWTPTLDFSREGGLAGAIEQCNGQGVCRKVDGTMCPSFQATRDEMHSTRGRANLLRALISRPSSGEAPKDPGAAGMAGAVFAALDLCLACKGCQAECPSGVDMAKLKYEFQNEYYSMHARRPRDYLFAHIDLFARLGAPFGPVLNPLMRSFAFRRLASWLGITSGRALPEFSAPRMNRGRQKPGPQSETVLLLTDTFTHFFEPDIENAARLVLGACGIACKTLPVRGAGRTLLSKGFVEQARRHAGLVLDSILQTDQDGLYPVIGLEPSEIYMLRDEYRDLLPDRAAEVAAVAARSFLIDEFLVRPQAENTPIRILRVTNKINTSSTNQDNPISLHGHCYQKAQPPAADGYPVGVEASAALLRACGYEVETIPSGCCGMAGAFGYEAEHYQLSMGVGELVLFPALRRAAGQGRSSVAAPGTSCRSQISAGTGLEALHPVQLIANGFRL